MDRQIPGGTLDGDFGLGAWRQTRSVSPVGFHALDFLVSSSPLLSPLSSYSCLTSHFCTHLHAFSVASQVYVFLIIPNLYRINDERKEWWG